tara:strand:- start:636 stop:887 length:252 start_codon:yes stop_codon:yes gene_type:complete
MNTLPFLPNEIVNKINTMAYQMHRLEQIQLNQEIFKNNINTLIKCTKEDYEEEEDDNSYGEYMLYNYGIFSITFVDNDIIWNY